MIIHIHTIFTVNILTYNNTLTRLAKEYGYGYNDLIDLQKIT